MRKFSAGTLNGHDYKFYKTALCVFLALSVLLTFAPAPHASAAEDTDAVYSGFAGIYQRIYADGHKLREKDGRIFIDNGTVSDMSDQFLPRDMGDGSYAFESRVSNQPHIERQLVEKYDEDYDEWVYEYDDVEVWNGYTRRLASAELGAPITASEYVFGKSDEFFGMNDDTQHWLRERSESYSELKPAYYLKSLDTGLYIGLSDDGELIAADEDGKAEFVFEALYNESPLYLLSKTEAYAGLSEAQRDRIERVYESVAGDAFERNGTAMAENNSPRGRLDKIYNNSKYQTQSRLLQELRGYISLGGGYVTTHRSSSYHVSTDLPGTAGTTVIRGSASVTYGHPYWYHWNKNTSKKFSVYDLNISGADGKLQQTIKVWVDADNPSSVTNAERFESIVTDIPYIYRSGITNILVENAAENSYYSAGQYLYIRLSHPNGAQSILDSMIHEMGHTLDAKIGGGKNWSALGGEWQTARQNDMFSMSSYGASENGAYNAEDFAEFCRFYFSCYGNRDRQRALQILCPNRYELLRKIRKENLSDFSLWTDGILPPSDNDYKPTATPTPEPTATPTPEPTATPTPEPTATPTPEPTATPTPEPTVTPTHEPTATPTPEPTSTPEPTATPTPEPTATPTPEPTVTPTPEPTATPTPEPTATPTPEPTATPTPEPTATPTPEPTATPTPEPTATPTSEPTATPTQEPTVTPTAVSVEITEVSDGRITVKVKNCEDADAQVILALYNKSGALIDLHRRGVPVSGETVFFADAVKGTKIKVMLWSGFDGLEPLAECAEIEYR